MQFSGHVSRVSGVLLASGFSVMSCPSANLGFREDAKVSS